MGQGSSCDFDAAHERRDEVAQETEAAMEVMEVQAERVSLVDEIPLAVRENTYFWRPRQGEWARRDSERRRRLEFETWYAKAREILEKEGITIEFEYRETTHHVYKRVTVTRNGKRSNMKAVINALRRAEQE